MSVKVAFDPQTFLRQRSGGISRLFTDLIAAFDQDPALGIAPELPFTWVNNRHAATDLASRGIKAAPHWLPREVLYAPWILRGLPQAGDAAIVHHTYYSRRFLGSTGKARRACTIYDMIPEKFAGTDWFTGSHLAKLDYVQHSDLVICISESTREDLLEHVGTPPGLVTVVPSAVGTGFQPGLPRLEALPRDYLLYVGGRKGYKDFNLLPAAIAELAKRGLDVQVVVVGPAFTHDEMTELSRQGVTERFLRVGMDDAQLRRAYANSLVVVQTSRYEGFGMTPLEGMASGVPVLVANTSSMPEVGGDVARYFEAGEADSLSWGLERLLEDEGLRVTLGIRGVQRAAEFTVQRMAERTATAYRTVLA